MNRLSDAFRQIREHPWLGHALLGVLALIMLQGILGLRRDNAHAAQTAGQLRAQQQRLRLIARQTQWPRREQAIASVLAQLRSRLWQAPTPAIAQATVQDRLNLLVRQQKLTGPNVRVNHLEAITGTKMSRVKAQLSFSIDTATFPNLLARLLREHPQIVIQDIEFGHRAGTRATLGLVFYFRQIGAKTTSS